MHPEPFCKLSFIAGMTTTGDISVDDDDETGGADEVMKMKMTWPCAHARVNVFWPLPLKVKWLAME